MRLREPQALPPATTSAPLEACGVSCLRRAAGQWGTDPREWGNVRPLRLERGEEDPGLSPRPEPPSLAITVTGPGALRCRVQWRFGADGGETPGVQLGARAPSPGRATNVRRLSWDLSASGRRGRPSLRPTSPAHEPLEGKAGCGVRAWGPRLRCDPGSGGESNTERFPSAPLSPRT